MEYTKGPWKTICNQDGSITRDGIISSVHAQGDVQIASVYTGHRIMVIDEGNRRAGIDAWPEGEANVTLIAASPLLLEACKATLDYIAGEDGKCDPYCCQHYLDEIKKMLAPAVAKATKGAP